MYEKNNHWAERRDIQKPVGEALEKYGSTRKLSLLINEKLGEISSLKEEERDALQ